ncbi:cupredoxin domain-containing protein [Halomonas cupida]|uniref:cupredoxin domain-containing protein n=1 Tax=Halomonas cupida TaxID=44933 RepID=UPI003A95B3F8
MLMRRAMVIGRTVLMLRTMLVVIPGLLVAGMALASGEHGGDHTSVGNADIDRTIRVQAGDMWFDPQGLRVAPGETIRFEIVNVGSLEHEFVIGDTHAQAAHREMMQEMGGGHDMHGMSGAGHDHGMAAVTIMPGETAELFWTAPDNADDLQYVCHIPGHYEAGMSGSVELQR